VGDAEAPKGRARGLAALLTAFAAACNLTAPPEPGPEDADADPDSDPVVPDVEQDADGERGAGPLLLVTERIEVIADRLCDLDDDGIPDNAAAELGTPNTEVFLMAMNVIVAGPGSAFAAYLPWVHDLAGPDDPETRLVVIGVHDADWPLDPADDLSGHGAFFAGSPYLDACGEPSYFTERASIRDGELEAGLAAVRLDIGEGTGLELRQVWIRGEIAPAGASASLDLCGRATIRDLGGETGITPEETTLLENLLQGGAAVGAPQVPGLRPDLDLDHDGLEQFVLDDAGRIETCIDGDGAPIEGRECWQDPRMADGFALAMRIAAVSGRYAGRRPRWEYDVAPGCEDGPPEVSLLDGPVRPEGPCAANDERCDPLLARPCCEPGAICSGANGHAYRCAEVGCEPRGCDYDGTHGLCRPYSTEPGGPAVACACEALARGAAVGRCDLLGAPGCTSASQGGGDTLCVLDWEGTAMCLDVCTAEPSDCDGGSHECYPLVFDEGGARVRLEDQTEG
jgi:hypothetical protein